MGTADRRAAGRSDPASPPPLPDHAAEFLASIRSERGLSRNTADAYRRDLVQYRETIDRVGTPGEDAVRAHLAHLRSRGLVPSSIARKFASIRAYHRFCVAEGYLAADPTSAIDPPSRPRSLPKALTVDEVTRVLAAIDRTTAPGRRDAAVIEFLYATGCRVAELCRLDLLDIDHETRTAIVTGKGRKQRLVPIGRYAFDALEAWLVDRPGMVGDRRDPDAVFVSTRGNRLSRQAVWRIVKAHGRAAGIPADRLSPHVFRHSAATHMVEGGADLRSVQEMLGHASLSTTQIYTRVTPDHLREIVITAHPRGR